MKKILNYDGSSLTYKSSAGTKITIYGDKVRQIADDAEKVSDVQNISFHHAMNMVINQK